MKMINLKMRLVFTGLIILGLGILFINTTQAVVDEEEYKIGEESEIGSELGIPEPGLQEPKEPEYVPGEVLVGLKEGVKLEDVLKDATIQPESFERVHNIKPAVNRFKKTYKLEKDSEGWYPFLGKNYKAVEEIPDEELFQEAYKAMPEVEKKLYRSHKIKLPEDISVEEAVAKLEENPDVRYVQPNYLNEIYMVPNDPYYHSQGSWGQAYDDLWGIKKIQCEAAWNISQGEGVIVAVIDTGVDYNHPDIWDNVWVNPDVISDVNGDGEVDLYDVDVNNNRAVDSEEIIDHMFGWDFAYGDNDPIDGRGHGTHVSGTIASIGNNNRGIIGVAPQAKIMAVKGLSDCGDGHSDWLAASLRYATDNGADIINNSWGCRFGCPSNPIIEEAVLYAHSLGVVLVFSAGNDYHADIRHYSPQNMPETVTVSASDHNDEVTDFSNIGVGIDVAAPGGGINEPPPEYEPVRNILSLRAEATGDNNLAVGDLYYRQAGTSMAAPHVAGVAGLIRAYQPNFTNENIRQVLRASADDVASPGFDRETGAGRINAARALMVKSVPIVKIISPNTGDSISQKEGMLIITGTASGASFLEYNLSYARSNAPAQWFPIRESGSSPVEEGTLGTWDIFELPDNIYLLRLVVTTQDGVQFQDIAQLILRWNPVKQITTDTADQVEPVISEKRIVWEDYRNDSEDIYLYDLATDTERRITSYPTVRDDVNISSNWIVWTDYRNGNPDIPYDNGDIYLYDINTEIERQMTTSLNSESLPAIDSDRIIWKEYRDGWHIYLYNLSNDTEQRITAESATRWCLAISENWIIWQENRYGRWYIYLYDLATDTERSITGYEADVGAHLAISGNRIVWHDYRNGNYDIYLYDLATDTERRITNNPAAQFSPDISGNQIVWVDNRNGDGDIFLYDLTTETERQITIDPADQLNPSISGDRIVWEDNRNGNRDIYLYELLRPPVLYDVKDQSVLEGQSLIFSVFSIDLNNDPLILSAQLSNGDPLSLIGATFTDHGDGIGTFSWTPSFGQVGSYEITFTVSDGELEDSETITITVLGTDRDEDGFADWIEEYIGTDPLDACPDDFNDSAWPPDFNNDKVVNILDVVLFKGKIGSRLGDPNYDPRFDLNADMFINLGGDVELMRPYMMKSCKINNPPVLEAIGNKTIKAGHLLFFAVHATDQDDDPLFLSAQLDNGYPLSSIGATFTDHGNGNGTFSWTPSFEQAGTYEVIFEVGDTKSEDYEIITITVLSPPDLIPTEILYEDGDLVEGQTVIFDSGIRNAGETDSSEFNIRWKVDGQDASSGSHAGIPALGTILDGNSHFTWTAKRGVHTITFVVDSDNDIAESDETNNATEVTTEEIIVDAIPPVVTITSPENGTIVSSAGFDFTGTATDSSGVIEVNVYVYDYGSMTYTVINELASYDSNTNTWNFRVQPIHITPGKQALLWVQAKDKAGNRSVWQLRTVTVSNDSD